MYRNAQKSEFPKTEATPRNHANNPRNHANKPQNNAITIQIQNRNLKL